MIVRHGDVLGRTIAALDLEGSWEPGPAHPRLTEYVLHVWRADLDAVSDKVAQLFSDDERARAERVLSARKARRWGRARRVLRELVGRYLERDPASLRFNTEAGGKPTARGATRLSFSLTHSGLWRCMRSAYKTGRVST
jgi:4'-phosphopantetheinyl transferase